METTFENLIKSCASPINFDFNTSVPAASVPPSTPPLHTEPPDSFNYTQPEVKPAPPPVEKEKVPPQEKRKHSSPEKTWLIAGAAAILTATAVFFGLKKSFPYVAKAAEKAKDAAKKAADSAKAAAEKAAEDAKKAAEEAAEKAKKAAENAKNDRNSSQNTNRNTGAGSYTVNDFFDDVFEDIFGFKIGIGGKNTRKTYNNSRTHNNFRISIPPNPRMVAISTFERHGINLSEKATSDEARKAFRPIAAKYRAIMDSPKSTQEQIKAAEKAYQELSQAYETLK